MSEPAVPSVIWMRPARGSRGPQPSRDRDAIARTAIAIADREGIAAVSMRRIAAEIGTGTSSLYRYFARKDDLLNLMVDGALAIDQEFAASPDWRAGLKAVGLGMRELFRAHPWLVTVLAGRPTLGPNRLQALERSLALLEPTGLALGERLVIINTLTSFVRGFVASEIADAAAIGDSGLAAEQWQADQAAYIDAIRRAGAYPRVIAMFDELQAQPVGNLRDASFAASLAIVIDGIAKRLG